jgi:hypothetical protein
LSDRAKSDIATWVSALAAIIAVGVSGLAYWQSNQTEKRLNQQSASEVYIGEAPSYAYARHPKGSRGQIWWVVMNTSPLQINNVWVEGEHGTYVRMWGVQGCSMYALPQGFSPVAVDYTNSVGQWRNPLSGSAQEDGKPLPSKGDESSPWFMGVENCG